MKIQNGDRVLIMMDVEVFQDSRLKRWLGITKMERQRRVVTVKECVSLGGDQAWPYVTFDYEANGRWVSGMYSWELRRRMREACPYALGGEYPIESVTI